MNFDINLIRDVEALLPNCVREDFLEHYSDWAEISSLMVDIKWEIKFIDLAGLDQIVVFGDVEEAAQSRGDPQHPLWKLDEQIESLDPNALHLAAKILHFHIWQDARKILEKPPLSERDYNAWLERKERPDPERKIDREDMARSWSGTSLYEERNHEIALFVIEQYPEDAAYICVNATDYFNNDALPYYARCLRSPQRRIFETKEHLFGAAHRYDSHTWSAGRLIGDVMEVIRGIKKPAGECDQTEKRP